MTTFLTSLIEHPALFTVLVIGILVFIGQTYDFILTMFGRKKDELSEDDKKFIKQLKEVIVNDTNQEEQVNQNYIYDDNIKGVYE